MYYEEIMNVLCFQCFCEETYHNHNSYLPCHLHRVVISQIYSTDISYKRCNKMMS